MKYGYYPFAQDRGFDAKLRQIINLPLESHIPVFADMSASMGRKFKQLLAVIAESVPFKPNMSKLAEIIGVGHNQMPNYFQYIEDAGMIAQLKDETGGIRGLGKAANLRDRRKKQREKTNHIGRTRICSEGANRIFREYTPLIVVRAG